MTTKREDLLRKVRALLMKANDRAVTPEEADAFRNKADELMAEYAIEEFELHHADADVKPLLGFVDFAWFWDYEQEPAVRSSMYNLMHYVYQHCRVAIVPDKYTEFANKGMPIVGFPADADYADLLFTSLLLQLARATNPKPTSELNYYENLEAMHQAGITWPEIARRMIDANIFWPGYAGGKNSKQIEHKMTRDYRGWAAENGRTRPYPNWQKHRRSFAAGFVSTVAARLREMDDRNESKTSGGGNPYAIVLRDIYDAVKAEVNMIFPDLHQIREERKKPGKKVAKPKEYSLDWTAYDKGTVAGTDAEIVGPAGQRVNRGGGGEIEG
jgi:hypothetical protein